MRYGIQIIMILSGGIGFAFYLSTCCTVNQSTWTSHFSQWVPIAVGAAGYLLVGWDTSKHREFHSIFWIFGRISAALAAAGVGYVVGRELFF